MIQQKTKPKDNKSAPISFKRNSYVNIEIIVPIRKQQKSPIMEIQEQMEKNNKDYYRIQVCVQKQQKLKNLILYLRYIGIVQKSQKTGGFVQHGEDEIVQSLLGQKCNKIVLNYSHQLKYNGKNCQEANNKNTQHDQKVQQICQKNSNRPQNCCRIM